MKMFEWFKTKEVGRMLYEIEAIKNFTALQIILILRESSQR